VRLAGSVALACAALALGAGCGRMDAPANRPETLQVAPSDAPAFLRGDPRLSVAHIGIRRLELPQVSGPGRPSASGSRATVTGAGRSSPGRLDGSPAEWNTFDSCSTREGFFRYRDFLCATRRSSLATGTRSGRSARWTW
jgi:hypothetical protein